MYNKMNISTFLTVISLIRVWKEGVEAKPLWVILH
jgi:hypothetical protein